MKNIFIKLLSYFKKDTNVFTGAILPEKADLAELPQLNELVATVAPVDWKILDLNKIPKYPIYSQNGSGSCVAMSMALIGTVLYYLRRGIMITFSGSWIYQKRTNAGSGMIGTDAFNIASKGLLLEELMPSQNLNDQQMDEVKKYPEYDIAASAFALDDVFVQLPLKDIETVASVIQVTGKPVMVWFEFLVDEWLSIPIVRVIFGKFVRHSTVALDYGMYDGEKAIAIQESWGFGSTSFGALRVIKLSFFNKRNIFSAYPRRFKFDSTGSKEIYDGTIVSFQKCMRSIGLFPAGVDFIENFGPITKKACVDFQAQQKLPVSGILDAETKSRLKSLFK